MKKVLISLIAMFVLTSCNCPICHDWPCTCKHNTVTSSGSSSSDYFSAATLIGQWQMSGYHDQEYMNGCGLIPKGIIFSSQTMSDRRGTKFSRCTMTYSVGRNPQWYEKDLWYNYVRRELTFYYIDENNEWEKFISFTYKNFLFPTLTIQDSFGTYEWNKVRVSTPK